MNRFDVVVIGAGPTGLACGIELRRRGIGVVLIDKGCVVNSIYNYPINMTFFTTPELLEIGEIPMTSLNEKPGRTEALKYYRRVADYYKLDVRQYRTVESISGDDGEFAVHARDAHGQEHLYNAKKVILATGYYDLPNKLNVPGEDLPKVIHYYREAHPYYNQDVVVIGGKNSAAISALELWWTGARVTLVHRNEQLARAVKYWIKPNIENRIKNGEIKAYFSSHVTLIGEDSVTIATPDGEVTIKNDFVFAMTGYRPDFEFMERHGIPLETAEQRPRTDPKTLESARKGIYLAGVIVAGVHTNEIFIENGRFHGKQVAEAIEAALAQTE